MPGGKAESTMPRDTARSPSLAGILWNGGAWVDSLFEDTPAGVVGWCSPSTGWPALSSWAPW